MLKKILKVGTVLNTSKQQEITGGMNPTPVPEICGGTGGKRTNYSQAQCFGYGYSWEYGACYICY